MGFPVCYTELLLHVLTALLSLRSITLLRLLGLSSPDPEPDSQPPPLGPFIPSLSEFLMAQLLSGILGSPPDNCAVCLHEFEPDDEVHGLVNCRQVFHKGWVDQWMGYDQKSCPLCRVSMVPCDVEAVINERFWATVGIQDFASFDHGYGDGAFSSL